MLKKWQPELDFYNLQISYHPDRLEKFCKGVVAAGLDRHVALLPTIVLIKGARPLKFMNDKVPGISVPQDVIDRVEKASDQAEEAYKQTLRVISTCTFSARC